MRIQNVIRLAFQISRGKVLFSIITWLANKDKEGRCLPYSIFPSKS